jgi:5-methylcytosine-specific restriction endonuclease McrA
MRSYNFTGYTNARLEHELCSLAVEERERTASVLAGIGEFSHRKLYLPAGFSSMHAYCVGRLGFTDDAAYNRIHAARATRRFPMLLGAVADGTLSVTAVRMLAPHLNRDNLTELVAVATRKTKRQLRRELIRRFGLTAVEPTVVEQRDRPQAARIEQLVPEQVPAAPARVDHPEPAAERPAELLVPEQVVEHFRLHVTLEGPTYDKLRRAQQLLGHAVPSGQVAAVLDRALDLLIEQLEKDKFAATKRPRRSAKASANKRYIPARVRREVRKRDGGRCTFPKPTGGVCGSRWRLQFDHIIPIAQGGESTVDNLQLRCAEHNQLEAERKLGQDFMKEKREEAMRARSAVTDPEPLVPSTS